MSKVRARIFNIMQYEKNPFTGEQIIQTDAEGNALRDASGEIIDFGLNETKISVALQHKSFRRWAYVCHDDDLFTEEDELKDARKIAGTKKPRHWHVVAEFSNAVELDVLARWFGIPAQYIEIPRGGNRAFLDCVEYLTHEKEPAKTQYSDDKIQANFDFREALEGRKKNGGAEMSGFDDLLRRVMSGEMLLQDVGKQFPALYVKHASEFKQARSFYLENVAERPLSRLNFYITGESGEGKGLGSRALARALFPNIDDDERLFFQVNSKNVAFDGYDGQPVIIWNEFRSVEFFKFFESRGHIFDLLETHPSQGGGNFQHVKFGKVRLVNSVNIINSVQSYTDFMNGLVGEYTDRAGVFHAAELNEKNQVGRRIGCIIPLHADDFDILLNKGLVNGSREFCEYYHFATIQGNFRKIALACGQNEALAREIEKKMLAPHVGEIRPLLNSVAEASPSELADLMASSGQVLSLGAELMKSLQDYFGDDLRTREIFANWLNFEKIGFDAEMMHMLAVYIFEKPENVPNSFKKWLLPNFSFDLQPVHFLNDFAEKTRRVINYLASALALFVEEHHLQTIPARFEQLQAVAAAMSDASENAETVEELPF